MKILSLLLLAAFGVVSGAPALAQDQVCKQALINLEDVKGAKSPPVGIEPNGPRIKPTGDYKAASDAAAFAVDAYREHGDVRNYCPKSAWPPAVKPENLKLALTAASKQNPKAFCGGARLEASAPTMARSWFNDAGPSFFADRAQQLQGSLDTTSSVKHQAADRHLADAEWMLEVISDLDAVCPNGEAALDLGSAKISVTRARDFAKENLSFLSCVKAREAWQPQMKAFDASVASNDPTAMTAAYKGLEKAAGPVNAACKGSEEGAKENDYLLAARKLRILFLTTPGCRDAALAMDQVRQSLNTASKSARPSYVTQIREAAKNAGAACKDPAAETWGNFVAWITEKNYERVPDKSQP